MSLLQGESWREDSQEPGAWVWPGLQPGKNRRFQASENPSPCSALDTPEPATCWSRADPEMVLTQRLLPVILLTLFWGPSKAGAQGEPVASSLFSALPHRVFLSKSMSTCPLGSP